MRLADGRWLRTNNDGSQDEGERANDDVLLEFFAPFAEGADADASADPADRDQRRPARRLPGGHRAQFAALATMVHAALAGEPGGGGIAVVNLNQRSLVAGDGESRSSTGCSRSSPGALLGGLRGLRAGPDVLRSAQRQDVRASERGPKVTRRLRDLYRLVHLRGQLHVTLRDLRSALAFMLTSGRDCAQIHELYRRATPRRSCLASTSTAGSARGTADRLLRQFRELDVAAGAEPALDRRLAAIGPTAGQAMMTIDQRGGYDLELLAAAFARLGQDDTPASAGLPRTSRRHGAGSTSSASMTSGRRPPSRSGRRSGSSAGSPGRPDSPLSCPSW